MQINAFVNKSGIVVPITKFTPIYSKPHFEMRTTIPRPTLETTSVLLVSLRRKVLFWMSQEE